MSTLTISKKALNSIVCFEVTSKSYYEKRYTHCDWPGLQSGVTIGIGYDLGYNTPQQIEADWGNLLPTDSMQKLVAVAGMQGMRAKAAITPQLLQVTVSFEAAETVFTNRTLPRFGKAATIAYPGLGQLAPDAVGGIISLVFNRGAALVDVPGDRNQRRKEMAAIRPLVAGKDYDNIAGQIAAMKRLWDGKPNSSGAAETRVQGLLDRRDDEAALVRNAQHDYAPEELVTINF